MKATRRFRQRTVTRRRARCLAVRRCLASFREHLSGPLIDRAGDIKHGIIPFSRSLGSGHVWLVKMVEGLETALHRVGDRLAYMILRCLASKDPFSWPRRSGGIDHLVHDPGEEQAPSMLVLLGREAGQEDVDHLAERDPGVGECQSHTVTSDREFGRIGIRAEAGQRLQATAASGRHIST